jgi:hypothetical protein
LERWNWFIAADASGRWITTNGYADVERSSSGFRATLLYTPDSEPCHVIEATLSDKGAVRAIVLSPGRDTPAFELSGSVFAEEDHSAMILLTDGTTVLGLAHGPDSGAGNL